MKHVVFFSGGAASAVAAKIIIEEHGHEDVILLHHDTKAEDPDTYRFIQQVSEYLKHPITEASDGRSLWDLIEKYGIPSTFLPLCTDLLKQRPGKRYLKTLNDDFTTYNGFGADEWKRVIKATLRAEQEGNKVVSPLYMRNITSQQVRQEILSWGICLPNAYRYLSHNNCIPCFKAGKAQWHKVWKNYREQFDRAMNIEENSTHYVFKDSSLKELSELWTAGDMPDMFEGEGIPCMCAD